MDVNLSPFCRMFNQLFAHVAEADYQTVQSIPHILSFVRDTFYLYYCFACEKKPPNVYQEKILPCFSTPATPPTRTAKAVRAIFQSTNWMISHRQVVAMENSSLFLKQWMKNESIWSQVWLKTILLQICFFLTLLATVLSPMAPHQHQLIASTEGSELSFFPCQRHYKRTQQERRTA